MNPICVAEYHVVSSASSSARALTDPLLLDRLQRRADGEHVPTRPRLAAVPSGSFALAGTVFPKEEVEETERADPNVPRDLATAGAQVAEDPVEYGEWSGRSADMRGSSLLRWSCRWKEAVRIRCCEEIGLLLLLGAAAMSIAVHRT